MWNKQTGWELKCRRANPSGLQASAAAVRESRPWVGREPQQGRPSPAPQYMQCTMHSVQCTMYKAQYIVHKAQCTKPSAQCTMHCRGSRATLPQLHNAVQHTAVHKAQHTMQSTMQITMHCSTLQCTGNQIEFSNCAVSISTGNCITQTTLSFSHRTVVETAAPAGWYKVQSAERERGRESGSWEQQQQLQVAPAFCLFLLLHSPTTTRPLLQALAPTQPMAHFYNPDLRLYLQKFLKFWALFQFPQINICIMQWKPILIIWRFLYGMLHIMYMVRMSEKKQKLWPLFYSLL